MKGFFKQLLIWVVLLAGIFLLTWISKPPETVLLTGHNCAEISERLAAQKNQAMSPAEKTDMANCSEP